MSNYIDSQRIIMPYDNRSQQQGKDMTRILMEVLQNSIWQKYFESMES